MNIPRKCRGCGAAIVFVKTTGGKAMPCDDAPLTYRTAQDGEIIITPNGEAVHGVAVAPGTAGATSWGYRPHWATCPDAVKFRKAVTAPAEQITMEQLAKAKRKDVDDGKQQAHRGGHGPGMEKHDPHPVPRR